VDITEADDKLAPITAANFLHCYIHSPEGTLFTARCTLVQSAVLPSHVVSLSVCL